MLPPFADITDLQSRGLSIPAGMEDAAVNLLDDASAHLRSVIGDAVWPSRTVSIDLYQPQGDVWLQVPVSTVRSITSLIVDGAIVANPRLVDGALYVVGPADVSLTLVAGLDEPPAELVSWTCVLAAEAFSAMQELGMLGTGMVASVALDDFRKSYHPQQQGGGAGPFALPRRVEEMLRSRYGRGGVTVVGTR